MTASSKLSKSKLWVDIDTASEITAVNVGTLLDWQNYFYPFLAPEIIKGEPRYTKADLDVVLQIKRLIHLGGFKKEGAKRALAWTFKRVA